VTHDWDDASALADEVGVIVDGKLRQIATPDELVARPADTFVASFTGANLLRGRALHEARELTVVELESGEQVFSSDRVEGEVGVVVYPWEITVANTRVDGSALNQIEGEIRSIVHVGNRVRVKIGPVIAEVTSASVDGLHLEEGGRAVAIFKATGTRLVPLGDGRVSKAVA
jgi:ABC-type Fe3+/spermidine/putrescine transport system ATPase subunit